MKIRGENLDNILKGRIQIMKKRLLLVLCISIMLLISACGKQTVANDEQITEPTTVVKTEATLENDTTEPAQSSTEIPGDRIPMVMVDGLLYYDTGKESTIALNYSKKVPIILPIRMHGLKRMICR